MGKKAKKGKAAGGGGGKSAEPASANVVIEYPPKNETMTMLYRKATYDVNPEAPESNLIRYHQDKFHREICSDYESYLRSKKFWHMGDELPDNHTPTVPKPKAPKVAKDDKKKKK